MTYYPRRRQSVACLVLSSWRLPFPSPLPALLVLSPDSLLSLSWARFHLLVHFLFQHQPPGRGQTHLSVSLCGPPNPLSPEPCGSTCLPPLLISCSLDSRPRRDEASALVFEHKEEDAEMNAVGRASSHSVLMPTSNWEGFFKQAASYLRCLSTYRSSGFSLSLVVEFMGLWVGREQTHQHCSRTLAPVGEPDPLPTHADLNFLGTSLSC